MYDNNDNDANGLNSSPDYFQSLSKTKDQSAEDNKQDSVMEPPFIKKGELEVWQEVSSELDLDYDEKFLIDGYIHPENMSFWAGTSGHGKTATILDVALSVANGIDWCGRETTQTGVLYVCGEGHRGLKKRIAAWYQHKQITQRSPNFYHTKTSQSLSQPYKPMELVAFCSSVPNIGLIIIDTLCANNGGLGDQGDGIATFLQAVRSVADITGAHVATTHHFGKDKDKKMRGSTQIFDVADSVFYVEKREGENITEVSVAKQRDMEELGPVDMRLQPVRLSPTMTAVVAQHINTERKASVVDIKKPKTTNTNTNIGKATRALIKIVNQTIHDIKTHKPGATEYPVNRKQLITEAKDKLIADGLNYRQAPTAVNNAINQLIKDKRLPEGAEMLFTKELIE